MALTTIPKENPARNNPRQYADIVLERQSQPVLRGPELPNGIHWCERTKDWYRMWRVSEIAALFEDSDWSTLADTAVLHNRLWSDDTLSASAQATLKAEIRKTTSGYGATVYDRLLRRIKFSDEAPGPASRQSAVDYSQMFEGQSINPQ